jgi:hypothetical protein
MPLAPHFEILETSRATKWRDAWTWTIRPAPRHAGSVGIPLLEGTAAGKTHVDPAVAGRLFAHVVQGGPAPVSPLLQSLSVRERDVLRLIGRGSAMRTSRPAFASPRAR